MRDINTGTINGDVHVYEQPVRIDYWACSNEQLFQERVRCQSLLKKEKTKRKKNILTTVLFIASLISVVSFFVYLSGQKELASLFLTMGGLMLTGLAANASDKPTELEKIQIERLKVIQLIFADREVE